MPRTTRTLVAEIIELDVSIVPNDAAMLPFITVANELVTEVCAEPAGPKVAYTAERLEYIERWLSAHFYTNRDPRTSSESAGVSASYQSQIGLGLDTSHYGQTAMRLDTNGGLSKLNEDAKKGKPKVSGFWAGTTPTSGS